MSSSDSKSDTIPGTMEKSFNANFEKAMEAVKAAEGGKLDVMARGTCQACLRQFVSKPYSKMKEKSKFTGEPMNYKPGSMVLVKHGFERPGHGYLVGECWGVGHPPFQLDCTISKHWHRHMLTVLLPLAKRRFADLQSGKEKDFSFHVRLPRTPGEPLWKEREKKTFFLTEGEPIPANWPKDEGPPDFKLARKRAIAQTKQNIEEIVADAEHLGKAIANWKYAPDALRPKEKPLNEVQTIRQWIDRADWSEFQKLPSPRPDLGLKTFADFARRMLRANGMSGRVAPTSYKYVRDEYEKLTGAKPLVVARPDRETEVISREQAEKKAAREAKLAAKEAAEKAKLERDAKVGNKAVADVEILRKALQDTLNDEKLMTALKGLGFVNPYTGQKDERSRYTINMEWIGRSGLLPLIMGDDTYDGVIERKKAKDRYSSESISSIRRDLREIYASLRKDAKEVGFKLKAL